MGSSLTVATWNVLHRIHAENWGEEPARRFPDEAARVAAITERIGELVAAGYAAICLQEVSGDQLASLRAGLPAAAQLFALRYRRIPARRDRAILPRMADAGEHLVTVVGPGPAARQLDSAAFPDDPGKGYLVVELDGPVTIVNTHVTHGSRHVGQLVRLGAIARARPGPVILLGDFNLDRAAVAATLGADVGFATPAAPALPTRPRAAGSKSQDIDHVVVLRAAAVEATVVDAGGLSDHNLVTARIA